MRLFLSLTSLNPYTLGNRKQVAVATAQILLQRFFYVSSLKQFGVAVRVHPWHFSFSSFPLTAL